MPLKIAEYFGIETPLLTENLGYDDWVGQALVSWFSWCLLTDRNKSDNISNDNSRLVWYAVITPLPPFTTFSRAWWCRVSWHAQSQGVAWHVADGCSRLQFAWLHLSFPRLSLHMNNTKPRTVRNTSGCQGRWSQARAVKSHPGPHISPVAGEEQLGHVRQEERQLSYHRVRADL